MIDKNRVEAYPIYFVDCPVCDDEILVSNAEIYDGRILEYQCANCQAMLEIIKGEAD